jgi:hypothetical protein
MSRSPFACSLAGVDDRDATDLNGFDALALDVC